MSLIEYYSVALVSSCLIYLNFQDQMILLMALADGTSHIRVGEVTLHTKTAIYIAEMLTEVCQYVLRMVSPSVELGGYIRDLRNFPNFALEATAVPCQHKSGMFNG